MSDFSFNSHSKRAIIETLDSQEISLSFKFLEKNQHIKDFTNSYDSLYEIVLKEAKQVAFRFLSTRPRSCYELEQRLLKEGFLNPEIKETINDLTKENYLNDLLFAQYLIESYQNKRPLGEKALKYKLQEKGIPIDIITLSLKEYLKDDNRLFDDAKKFLEKNLYRFEKYTDPYKKAQKIFDFLYRRGFSTEIIKKLTKS